MSSGADPIADEVRQLRDRLSTTSPAATDGDRIERLRLFEELKSAVCAAQAREAVAFDASQRAAQAVAGVASKHQGRGIASQIGLALRISPFRAGRWLGWAKIVTTELPETLAELTAGRTTEWRAMLVARETAVLTREDRAAVDRELAPRLSGWGDRQVENEARRAAYRLDPAGAVARARRAESDRYVSLRPAPDTMCRLTALLPVAQGVAAYAALRRAADSVAATGVTTTGVTTTGVTTTVDPDGGIETGPPRGREQIMADTLVQRLTGQASADAVPVEIAVVMADTTLLNEDDEPAEIPGYGPVPAGIARTFAVAGAAPRWLRRLYRRPGRSELITMDTRRRLFTTAQRAFLQLRDRTCRTPWCDAPVAHADHVLPWTDGGRTTVRNGQGLCRACNHAKQAPGWHSRSSADGAIDVITPTRHVYPARAPDPNGSPRTNGSAMEQNARDLLRVVAA